MRTDQAADAGVDTVSNPGLLPTWRDAWDLVAPQLTPLEPVEVPLPAAAGMRIATDITAIESVPGFDASMMDGFALGPPGDIPDRWTIVGTTAAGDHPTAAPLAAGTAAQIMTGGPVPAGAERVLPQEHAHVADDQLTVANVPAAGQYIRAAASDVAADDVLARAGDELTPGRLGLLASAGVANVTVHRVPCTALISTGDELVGVGDELPPGGVRDASTPLLAAMLMRHGFPEPTTSRAPDTLPATVAAISAQSAADVLVICGGMSVGRHDHVRPALQELGANEMFWRVRMRPGKPIAVYRLGDQWVVGLPGNPVSAVTGMVTFVLPILRALAGMPGPWHRERRVQLTASAPGGSGRSHLVLAATALDDNSVLTATPTHVQGSTRLDALAQADALVEVPHDADSLPAGSTATAFPL